VEDRSFGGLLAVLVLLAGVLTAATVAAKPIEPHPSGAWDGQAVWGIRLKWENSPYSGNAWPGVGTYYVQGFPGGAAYFQPVFEEADTDYVLIVWNSAAEPSSYTWHVRFRSWNRPTAGYLKWELENATHWFVPPDYLVVLENQAENILINLREEDNHFFTKDDKVDLIIENAVNVTITPSSQSGNTGDNVSYTVTIQNTGRYDDTYWLSSTLGTLQPSNLSINAGDNDTATLEVSLPVGAGDIIVTADGSYADDNCMASAFGMPVSISISPSEKSALPGETVDFEVAVKNLGENVDNYLLEENDNSGWNPTLDNNFFEDVGPGENRTTTLTVMIPENIGFGAEDNLIVIVTSQAYPWASDNATCIARAGFYGVEVSILPGYQENAPGGGLNYTVRISNTGDLDDSYELTLTDNINGDTYWEDNISLDNSLLVVPAGENRTTTLKVTIPDNATPGTNDNITVTATSQADNTVCDNASCIAHVARLSVSISPSYQSGLPGEKLIYTVEIKNNENTEGDYYSVVTDNFGWKLEFGIKRIILYPYGEAWTILKVTVPENAIGCTEDTVTVTMVSSTDNTVRYSASCIAHATIVRGVEVSVSPKEKSGLRGSSLTYTVTVSNTGNVDDTYDLTADDNANWGLEFSPPSLTIPLRSSDNATLIVTIPENAEPGTSDGITVVATSRENTEVRAEDNCIAYAFSEFTLHLVSDWNLVSFAIVNENTTKYNLFTEAGVDPVTVDMLWFHPYLGYQIVGLHERLKDNLGYWIRPKNLVTITISGISKENENIYLVSDWNCVGLPVVNENTTKYNLFTEAGVDPVTVDMLWYDPYLGYQPVGLHEQLKDNLGYYIRPPISVTLRLP